MIKDPEIFYNEEVLGNKKPMTGSALNIGTYFHTAILEPHKLDEDCAVWKGFRKGKEWEAFEKEHGHKAIITGGAELDAAMNCVNAVKASPIAMKYIKAGMAEVSAFLPVEVYRGRIYYYTQVVKGYNAKVLTREGWASVNFNPKSATVKIGLKVRADCIGLDDGYILDLKSASGDVKNVFIIQGKISELDYDLSASLYLDVFGAANNSVFHTFIWTFASKDKGICKNHKASYNQILVGRAKWAKAVIDLAKNMKRNWKFVDEMSEIGPKEYEMEWITRGDVFPEEEVDDEILDDPAIAEAELSEEQLPLPTEEEQAQALEDERRRQIIEEDLL